MVFEAENYDRIVGESWVLDEERGGKENISGGAAYGPPERSPVVKMPQSCSMISTSRAAAVRSSGIVLGVRTEVMTRAGCILMVAALQVEVAETMLR